MITALALRTLARSPRRLIIGLLGVAIPVALFAATGFFVDTSAQRMTLQALAPVQVDMQALLRSPLTPAAPVAARLSAQPGVRTVEQFASVDLPALLPGSGTPRSVRVFAVGPDYPRNHPWVRVLSGDLSRGALLTDSLAGTAGGGPLRLQLPGTSTPLSVPVGGTVDLHKADTWFAVLSGDNQGNVAFVPDAVVVDIATFNNQILPALQAGTAAAPQAGTAPGSAAAAGTLSIQEHITFDRSIFAADPGVALTRSTGLRRTLERSSPGQITVVDNLGDSLAAASKDAINAKVLFLFLGVPGVLVAAGLAATAAAAVAAAQRRELALLRLRGATEGQISQLTAAAALGVGITGSALGIGLAALGISVLEGPAAWRGVSPASILLSGALATAVGLIVTAISLRTSSRTVRRTGVASQRAQLDPAGTPLWSRRRLDLVAIAIGAAVLGINIASGGFRTTPSEGQTLSLSFYLLLAPIALWIGVTLLGLRMISFLLARLTRPERARPLTTWPGAALRWLGRRPGRAVSTAIIGVLAVAFGTNLIAFVHTYDTAKRTEAAISVGADLRVTPAAVTPPPVPPLTAPDITSSTPVRIITLGVGTDKRPAYSIDPGSFAATVPIGPLDARGKTIPPTLLSADPAATLISSSFGKDFNVLVGDPLTVSVPDGHGGNRTVTLHTVGEFTTATPASPGADLIVSNAIFGLPDATPGTGAAAIPAAAPPAPDFYLARLAPGANIAEAAARLSHAGAAGTFTVLTFNDALAKEQSTLATLNLTGLSRIETAGTLVIATLGLGLLGAFLVFERRREYAVLRSLGATTRQVLIPPALEGTATLLISLLLGIPIGLGMTAITAQVLTPLFSISPTLQIPLAALSLLATAVAITGAAALALALILVARLRTVSVLRES